ncbi:MAG TPA: hypothetical protein VLX68_07970 [Chitinivibrionales bacterium]|nr:hypothetical protein [Chitinivibrionales bacterium]
MKKVTMMIAAMLFPAAMFAAQQKDSASAAQLQIETAAQPAASADTLKEQVEKIKGEVDGINESYAETKATVGALSKIKVSGYIQAQWVRGDTAGVVDGSNKAVTDRFLIKRGRVKTTYDAGLSQYVLELDATQDGIVIKDVYAMFKDPWLKSFALTVGSQDRPFGYEVHYSSSQLESPERSRVIGTFFPKEKDLGAMLEFAQEDGPASWLNAKVGVFNGQTNILDENDGYKDVIGRLGVNFNLPNAGVSISGGVSGYYGQVQSTDTTGKVGKNYAMSGNMWVANANTKFNENFLREYYGGDIQFTYATPVIGGTCIKGEYVAGKQPGTAGSSQYYATNNSIANAIAGTPAVTYGTQTTSSIYQRNAMGWYAYFIQNIDPASLQLVLKYDIYDPNTAVTGTDFDTTKSAVKPNLTAADIAYNTFGLGLLWYVPWATNIRCMLFYEFNQNEKLTNPIGGLAKYTNDLTDNLLTARIQVKF